MYNIILFLIIATTSGSHPIQKSMEDATPKYIWNPRCRLEQNNFINTYRAVHYRKNLKIELIKKTYSPSSPAIHARYGLTMPVWQ